MTSPEPLTDAELDKMNEVLQRFGDQRSMSLEQLDGFLAALVCGPAEIPQRECFRTIWGDEIINEDTFAAQPLLRDFIVLVTRHRDVIAHTLKSDDIHMPLLLEGANGAFRGNNWAKGFLRGTEFYKADWAALLGDEENGGSLVAILALAHEDHPDPEMRPYQGPINEELREKLIIGAAAGVTQIFQYFEAQRLLPSLLIDDSATYRRIAPKMGRNERCPCGSGKKFKHCCGDLTLH